MNQNTFGSMDIGLKIVPASGKIYDITHADTNEHSVALPAGYPANTKALIVRCSRVAGTGNIYLNSVPGASGATWQIATPNTGVWIRATDGMFYYSISVANDDWDIFAVGRIEA